MKVERMSYEAMTPSAARGILEAVHWRPAIRWVVDRIHVLHEIVYETVRRNEIENKIAAGSVKAAMAGKPVALSQFVTEERQQRSTLLLRRPAYLINAHFVLTEEAGPGDSAEKHYNMFVRRARLGQCFHRPYLGCREFAAQFRLIEASDPLPSSFYQDQEAVDLGWMLHDLDFQDGMTPLFFQASMRRGIIHVPSLPPRGAMPLDRTGAL